MTLKLYGYIVLTHVRLLDLRLLDYIVSVSQPAAGIGTISRMRGFQPGNPYRFQPGNQTARGNTGGKGKPKRLHRRRQLAVIAAFQPDSPVTAEMVLTAVAVILKLGSDEDKLTAATLLLERIAGRPRSRRLGK